MKNFLILSHLYRIEASQQLHCLVSSNITFTKHYIDKDRTPPACFYAACLIVFMLQKERRRFCDGSSARPEDRFCAVCVQYFSQIVYSISHAGSADLLVSRGRTTVPATTKESVVVVVLQSDMRGQLVEISFVRFEGK